MLPLGTVGVGTAVLGEPGSVRHVAGAAVILAGADGHKIAAGSD